jgi:hypothetical protein
LLDLTGLQNASLILESAGNRWGTCLGLCRTRNLINALILGSNSVEVQTRVEAVSKRQRHTAQEVLHARALARWRRLRGAKLGNPPRFLARTARHEPLAGWLQHGLPSSPGYIFHGVLRSNTRWNSDTEFRRVELQTRYHSFLADLRMPFGE